LIAAVLFFSLCQYAYSAEKTSVSPSSLNKVRATLQKLLQRSNERNVESTGGARENRQARRNAAVSLLKLLGKEAISALEYIALHDKSMDLRDAALNVLKYFKSYNAHETLLSQLTSGSPEQRLFALENLKSHSAIYKLSGAECKKHILPLITDADRPIRVLAKKIIRAYRAVIPNAPDLAVKLLKSHDGPEEEKIEGVELLGSMIEDQLALDYLLSLLRTAGAKLRLTVIRVLGYSKNTRAVEALGGLLEIENEEPEEVRRIAAIGLGRTGSDEALAPLIKALESDDKELRRISGNSLKKITGVKLGANQSAWETWTKIESARRAGRYKPGMFRTKRPSRTGGPAAGAGEVKPKGFKTYAKFLIAVISISILVFIYKFLLPGKGGEIGLRKVYIPSTVAGDEEVLRDVRMSGEEVDAYISGVAEVRGIPKDTAAPPVRKRAAGTPRRVETAAERIVALPAPEPAAEIPSRQDSESSKKAAGTFSDDLEDIKEFYKKRAESPGGVSATSGKKPARPAKPEKDSGMSEADE